MEIHVTDDQEKLRILQGKDDKTAYTLLKQMMKASKESSKYVQYLDTFLNMTGDERSFVRVRGFRMACAQGVHLSKEKMKEVLEVLADVLDEEKPTAVRRYLTSLYDLCVSCSQLRKDIINMVSRIEPERYGESMGPLIRKDIRKIQRTGR